MTPLEVELRQGLRELADQPSPSGVADRALAGARRLRLGRRVRLGAGVALVAVAGLVVAATSLPSPAGPVGLPPGVTGDASGAPPSGPPSSGPTPGLSCGSTTDEASPAQGVPRTGWPQFVALAVQRLPPRDDYTLQSSFGACDAALQLTDGYAVINLGPNREHGHLTLNLGHSANAPASCAALQNPLFCEESTVDEPLVFAIEGTGARLTVGAVYPGNRMVWMESLGAPIGADALRVVVTDRTLAGLLT